VWIEGTALGKVLKRQALGTRSWEEAEAMRRRMEGGQGEPVTIKQAIADFRLDIDRRNLSPETSRKYVRLLRDLEDFAKRAGVVRLDSLAVADARRFVGEWPFGPNTATKQIERLKTFFRFCRQSRWIADDPSEPIKPAAIRQSPTLPYTRDEMAAILAACPDTRLRAFVLVMRYSGLRVGDVARLEKPRIQDGKLMLYTQKTGTPVYVPLPDVVVNALDTFPHANAHYFFWSGESTKDGVSRTWINRLAEVFKDSKVPQARSHRFRDTFAVELLLQGVPLERISVLLGHSSIRVTERHYAPWVKARQEQAEADVRRTWQADPLLLAEGYNPGTTQ
jgi:integrase